METKALEELVEMFSKGPISLARRREQRSLLLRARRELSIIQKSNKNMNEALFDKAEKEIQSALAELGKHPDHATDPALIEARARLESSLRNVQKAKSINASNSTLTFVTNPKHEGTHRVVGGSIKDV